MQFKLFTKRRSKGMKPKLISQNLLSDEQLKEFINRDCKLLTSKNLAEVLGVSDGALRKQRSKNRSLFPFSKLRGRIYYPADLIVKTLHEHLQGAQLR
tara:strand:- start:775 stop:1068 length:294 start_codon:yes stop_codon:yes gene_type:complete